MRRVALESWRTLNLLLSSSTLRSPQPRRVKERVAASDKYASAMQATVAASEI